MHAALFTWMGEIGAIGPEFESPPEANIGREVVYMHFGVAWSCWFVPQSDIGNYPTLASFERVGVTGLGLACDQTEVL